MIERVKRRDGYHLPLAQILELKEAGQRPECPSRQFRKRAGEIRGFGDNFTDGEIDAAVFSMFMTEMAGRRGETAATDLPD
jgi:hypothetical protein